MAAAPRTPADYSSGVLAYAFFCGTATLRFPRWSYLRLEAGPPRKYAALSSLGNVPVIYMTAVNGWVHDRFGTGWMLQTDALSAILFCRRRAVCLAQDQCHASSGSRGGPQSCRLELREPRDS
jgi:hypothetical protein